MYIYVFIEQVNSYNVYRQTRFIHGLEQIYNNQYNGTHITNTSIHVVGLHNQLIHLQYIGFTRLFKELELIVNSMKRWLKLISPTKWGPTNYSSGLINGS